jgi:hypothetical protein
MEERGAEYCGDDEENKDQVFPVLEDRLVLQPFLDE